MELMQAVLISTPIFVVLSLTLALALNRPGKLATFLRATFFCASVFSVTLITLSVVPFIAIVVRTFNRRLLALSLSVDQGIILLRFFLLGLHLYI